MNQSAKSKEIIESSILEMYRLAGGDTAAITVSPRDGDWPVALSYIVSHRSGKAVGIPRRYFDDDNFHEIERILAVLDEP